MSTEATHQPVPDMSPEWFKARAGIVTCSVLNAIMSNGKGNATSAKWDKLLAVKTWEVLAGTTVALNAGYAAERGTMLEATALQAYSDATGQQLTKPGLLMHPTIKRFGGTPDGLTENGISVQVKCPLAVEKVVQLKIHGDIEHEYFDQIQGELLVTGFQMAHLVVFDDRLPPEHQLTIISVPKDAVYQGVMVRRIEKFLQELDDNVLRVKGLKL